MRNDDSDDEPRGRRKSRRKKTTQKILEERYKAGDPAVDLLGEPSGKFEYYVLYSGDLHPSTPAPTPAPRENVSGLPEINMFHPCNFPDYEFDRDNDSHTWKIRNPTVKNPDGTTKPLTPAETTLNWQTENALAQNAILKEIAEGQAKLLRHMQKYSSDADLTRRRAPTAHGLKPYK